MEAEQNLKSRKNPGSKSDPAENTKKKRKKAPPPPQRDLIGSFVFAIPFLAVTANNLRNATAMCAAMFTVLVPVVLLRFLLQQRLGVPRWAVVPLCTLVALMLASLSYYIIRYVSAEITDALGTYLYLLAAYPVVAAPSSEQGVRSGPTAVWWALKYGFRFTCLGLVMALIRELLAYGQVWGISLSFITFRAEGAKMTFFGLILMGILLAGLSRIRTLLQSRKAPPPEQAPLGEPSPGKQTP